MTLIQLMQEKLLGIFVSARSWTKRATAKEKVFQRVLSSQNGHRHNGSI